MYINLRNLFSYLFILTLLSACGNNNQLFQKVDLEKAGIGFKNTLEPTDDFNIIDYIYFYNGGGVSAGDINNDGLPDLFFTANQGPNKLYLNKGDLKFEDITESAGVSGNSSWNTGSSLVDINGDGLLDIYVCAVVGIKGMSGHNELYINNGDNTFSEESKAYGLDFDTFSSSSAFFDYDNDGDLDLYLLNHAIHTQESFGRSDIRNKRSYETGDRLLKNEGGKFIDVSEEANIFGGINGYGLGISIADFNQDNYPDIYVGNDFHEDDYYYINNGNGTFSEQGKSTFTHMSRFSMGNDAADINNDGLIDIISLDILPQDEVTIKRSEGDESNNTLKLRIDEYGYHYQFARNMLQINTGEGVFLETALLSKVGATDWSWSALFSDLDMDGNQDLFIANGIPKRPNDLDYINFVSSETIKPTINSTKMVDQKALDLMPDGKVQNYVFQGTGDLQFNDKSLDWLPQELTCSTATSLADLDNDGDLDIIINNVDDAPSIYLNSASEKSNYLKLKFDYNQPNSFGIGTKAFCYYNEKMQYRELFSDKGFQASSEPIIHFGLGNSTQVDSLKIVWPDGSFQVIKDVAINQNLVISPDQNLRSQNLNKFKPNAVSSKQQYFKKVDPSTIGINYKHIEDSYTDFDRSKLLPFQQSDRGPATAIGDINNDGLSDVYFGGSKRIPSKTFMNSDTGFYAHDFPEILKDSINEEVAAVITDINNDGKSDLFIVTGGADFYGKSKPLLDHYYIQSDSGFTRSVIPDSYMNGSCVKPYDFDNDGDMDLFIGNQSISKNYGETPESLLLINENGEFNSFQSELFDQLGMVTDAIWSDYNGDGYADLIVVGEWMAPKILSYDGNKFNEKSFTDTPLNGLWQSIIAFDLDEDGDKDYVLGNWGLNSKYRATQNEPLRMYFNDFDNNQQTETIVAISKEGKYYPMESFNVIAGQIVSLKKKFTSYKAFAGKSIEEIFDENQLENSIIHEVHELASGYLENNDGNFTFKRFDEVMQLAPVMSLISYDFDGDQKDEVLAAGNYFGLQPIQGRLASFPGAIIQSNKEVISGLDIGLSLIGVSTRELNIVSTNGSKYLLVTANDDNVQVYQLKK